MCVHTLSDYNLPAQCIEEELELYSLLTLCSLFENIDIYARKVYMSSS